MTITALDPATALLLIDLQRGTVAQPLVHPVETLLERAAQLAAAFRRSGLPVVLVNAVATPSGRTAYGSGHVWPQEWSELVPELRPEPEDVRVSKTAWSPFTGTDLHDRLRAVGTTQVVIAGLVTSFGIESTARAAYDLGYNVALAVDAISDLDQTSHDHAVERVFPVLGQTGTTAEILGLLTAGRPHQGT